MKIAYCITGSFCNHKNSISVLESLTLTDTVVPVFSDTVSSTDTRFGTKEELFETVTRLCGRQPITDIAEAEKTITDGGFDVLAIVPCTGNTLAKIANGITDTPVLMALKAHLRNGKPVVLGIASNDALSANFKNIGICAEKKNVFLVPMKQDNPIGKPTSLVCDFSLVRNTINDAVEKRQIRPLFI